MKPSFTVQYISFYNIINGLIPDYLQSYIEVPSQDHYPLRSVSAEKLKPLPSRWKSFKKFFFLIVLVNGIDLIQKLETQNPYINLKNQIKLKNLKILCIMSVHDPLGMKLLSRWRLKFSHLSKHKFRQGFNDTVNPMCPCGTEVETNKHFLLRCYYFSSQRSELFDNLYNLDPSFSKLINKEEIPYLLHGSTSDPNILNKVVINLVIKFFKSTGRFDKPLIYDQWKVFFLFWFSFYSKVFSFLFFHRNYFEFEYYGYFLLIIILS